MTVLLLSPEISHRNAPNAPLGVIQNLKPIGKNKISMPNFKSFYIRNLSANIFPAMHYNPVKFCTQSVYRELFLCAKFKEYLKITVKLPFSYVTKTHDTWVFLSGEGGQRQYGLPYNIVHWILFNVSFNNWLVAAKRS